MLLMKTLSKLGLAQRLFATSAILVLAMVGLAVVLWFNMQTIEEHAHQTQVSRLPQLERITDIETHVLHASLLLRHAILARTPEEKATALADSSKWAKQSETGLLNYGKALFTEAGRKAYAPIPALMTDFLDKAVACAKMIEEGKKEEAFAFLADQLVPARNRLLEQVNSEQTRQVHAATADLKDVEADGASSRLWSVGTVLVLTLGLMGFAAYVVSVMRQLGGEPSDLRRVAQAVAAGDLNTSIVLRAGDNKSIMATLKAMSESLANTVKTVRQNAESVATASQQIASGNADLSGRTEQQASSLQQASASMEQLGSTVQQNADNARQANQLAISSSAVASQGGELVREVVGTMREINDSSKKIADIIGVIDGIAFQTNILALNAAVEAARAGEQGRGFAVVASEVRSLAQRSGQAAREIKSLINASVERVAQGTQQVDRAGATMQEIVASIQRVSDIVAEISAASTQQSSGVLQVGQSVTEMDKATQQNAALVEESAAAAESLKQQSHQLVQAVAVFKLA
jgi:methyl-accepting chemotaxis protein